MKPVLVVQEPLVPGASAKERMAAARAAGFDGLEVRDAGAARHDELRAALAGGGAIPTCCPEGDGFLADFDPARRARAREQLARQLDGLAAVGGSAVIAPAAWGMWTERLPPFEPPPRTPAEDRAILVEQLAALGEHARQAGVLLLLEPLNRYEDHMVNTLEQAAALVREAGSPAVRILADTYHMNIEEDDPCAALRAAVPVLGAVHLSDSNRHQPGTGHVPFDAVMATLRDAGFAGPLSVECRMRGDGLAGCGAFLRELVDAHWG